MKIEIPKHIAESLVTRFAPSPTGHLHAGHVMNAVFVWGIAGALGGRVILRIEDHDQGRYRTEYEESILEDLDWLGFVPDLGSPDEFRKGPTHFRQSDNGAAYENALNRLGETHRMYYCDCSRKDLANRAPAKSGGSEIPYDGFCREKNRPAESEAKGMRNGLRLVMPDEEVSFDDALLGEMRNYPARQCGDLLLRDRRGDWTYHFAVVTDDLDQGVNLVIRGGDLLDSTARQILLGRMLGRREAAVFLHHPLLLEDDGRKLSKRFASPSIRDARDKGVSAADYLGDVAAKGGLIEAPRPLAADELPGLFQVSVKG